MDLQTLCVKYLDYSERFSKRTYDEKRTLARRLLTFIKPDTQLINEHSKLKISISRLNPYLEIWGYIPQNHSPRKFCHEMKTAMVFLEKNYNSIYNQAKREKATIYWCVWRVLRYD